jgi:predicted small lipoprotein YifL
VRAIPRQRLERLAAALMLLALAGCGAMSGPVATVQPANTVTVSREQGGKFIGLVGPRIQHDEPFLGVPNTNFSALRSWIDTRTGEINDQLYVEDSYFGAKRNWNMASANGQTLRFVPISTNEISCEQNCSYAEEFAAAIPDPLLRASTQGLPVRFTAQSGADKLILVPGELVQKQIAAVDQARATLPSVAAAPGPAAAPALQR